MALVAVFLHTTYEGASLRSRMECRILQLTPEFFANPSCPPNTSSAAPAPDLAVVSREELLENSSTAAGEEATLPMGLLASSDGGFKDAAAN